MNTHSPDTTRNIEVIARKNLSLVLQAIAQAGQAEIAQRLNFSTSTVSRIKSERLEEVIKVLAACGLKIVPQDCHGDHAEFIDAALVFAAYGLTAVRKDQSVLNQEST
ncbi:MAG: Lrp/AsnC family transcriptional regulator [Spongiibacteraceae bacterium]|nr:Lrp/AsnC family transcriptional regulator [Spongiibacteraceae bacterium]